MLLSLLAACTSASYAEQAESFISGCLILNSLLFLGGAVQSVSPEGPNFRKSLKSSST